MYVCTFGFYDALQEHVVQSVSADGKTITLALPLKYTHWGADGMFAEVASLTRNILFRGEAFDTSDDEQSYGGHIMITKAAYAKVNGAEFTSMGQRHILARYPLHFHHSLNLAYAVVKRNAFHHNHQRCFTIHDSNGVKTLDNVGHDTIGHCFFFEDASEELNVLDHNLASNAQSVDNGIIPSDSEASCFWITNANNTVREGKSPAISCAAPAATRTSLTDTWLGLACTCRSSTTLPRAARPATPAAAAPREQRRAQL